MQGAEVGIVGAGPIGLELAAALKRAKVDYLHFDAKQIGYTISWFAPQTRFFSSSERIAIAGVPLQTPDGGKCSREQYLAYLRCVIEQFDLRVRTYEPVLRIERKSDGLHLSTEACGSPRKYVVKNLVLATGGTSRPRRLNIPGEDLPHVSHYFDDPHRYFRKRVLIVGGKNSAVEAALRCYNAGAHVSISYRREKFDPASVKYWLLPEINGLIQSGKIETHFHTVPVEITPATVALESVGQSKRFEVPADFVLLLIGYEADMTLCRMAGVELSGPGQKPVHDPNTMRTNVPNVYVAGTVVGGTQDKYQLFIENCHVHVDRIVAALTGSSPPANPAQFAQPET